MTRIHTTNPIGDQRGRERPQVVSVRDACRICGIGRTSVYKCLAKGELQRATGTSLKRCLITLESIEAFSRAARAGG